MQSEFVIHTDHKSLIHLNKQRLHTPWQHKVFYKLLGLCYRVVYRRGADNGVADALSRRQPTESLMAILALYIQWLSTLQKWYDSDPDASALLSQLAIDDSTRPPFSLQQGIIRYKQRIWLGSNLCYNSRLCLHCIIARWAATSVLQSPSTRSAVCSFGPVCARTSCNLYKAVLFVSKPNQIGLVTQVYWSHCQCQILLGK